MTDLEKEEAAPAQEEEQLPSESFQHQIAQLKAKIEQFPENIKNTQVQRFSLTVRLSNVFKRQEINILKDLLKYTPDQISSWPGLGRRSIREFDEYLTNFPDLNFGTEKNTYEYFSDGVLSPDWKYEDAYEDSVDIDSFLDQFPSASPLFYIAGVKKQILEMPEVIRNGSVDELDIPARLQNVFKSEKINKLHDLLSYSDIEIARWSNLGKRSLAQLYEVLRNLDYEGLQQRILTVAAYNSGQEVSCAGTGLPLKECFFESLEKIKVEKYRAILEERLGINGRPKTLDETGVIIGVTRERVRQIQEMALAQIIKGESWDDLLKLKLERLMSGAGGPIYLDNLAIHDKWFCGFEGNPKFLLKIIDSFSHLEINHLDINGRLVLSRIDTATWLSIKQNLIESFEFSLDLEYTLEDIEMIVEKELVKYNAGELSSLMFDTLYQELIFSNIKGDLILTGVGNSRVSLLRAILDASEVPLHYEEVAKIYIKKYGVNISHRNIHAGLSYGCFLIFGRGIYGTSRHLRIPIDTQKAILCASEGIILGVKDKQWHTSEILREIPMEGFDLSPDTLTKYTLSIILSQSSKVRYLGRLVWLSADSQAQDPERLHINKAVLEVLRKAGKPMKTHEIQDEIEEFRSLSQDLHITLHPNELFSRIDPITWGLIDRDFILTEKKWELIKDGLYRDLAAKERAYHVTELIAAIEDEDLPETLTDHHVLGVLLGDSRFKLWNRELIGLSTWQIPNRFSFSFAILLICREAGNEITTEDIVLKSLMLLGHDFKRNLIGIHMNRNGFIYSTAKRIWERAP